MTAIDGQVALAALDQRLDVASATLGVVVDEMSTDLAVRTSQRFGALVDRLVASRDQAELWLLLVAMTGALPHADLVRASVRELELQRAGDFSTWLLEAAHRARTEFGSPNSYMDVVGGVVVDVDFSARNDLHTGIQRVVRETAPRWAADEDIVLTAWTATGGAMRRLTDREEDRVLRWHAAHEVAAARPETSDALDSDPTRVRLVVPWRTTVVLLENPRAESCSAIVATSLFSGSEVVLVGYDCIPALSPGLIHTGLPDRFMRYLEVVKHSSKVAGISHSAALEFRGFTAMLGTQGLPGPAVTECVLPVEAPPALDDAAAPDGVPSVACVGSFEPRKNQVAVLHAAERLWRQGSAFHLDFVGGGGWPTEFDRIFARLVRAGRPLTRRTAVTDRELWATLRRARFTVFVSLHEGFGLPVAESLACGTPCLTTNYGSTKEIADGGGAVVVDPHDDIAIADQMRRMLEDDDLIAELQDAARNRVSRTWSDYAAELWDSLVATKEDAR